MKKTDTKITRYESGPFWIDIVEEETTFEAWMCRMNFTEYMFMFGVEKNKAGGDVEFFVDLVEGNLDEYKDYYDIENGYYEDGQE